MKKLLFGIILILISGITFGQFISLTPKIGFTLSDYYEKILVETTFKLGYSFGVSSNFSLSRKLDLKPELMFKQKGTKSAGLPNDNIQYYTFNYLNIPLLIKYNLGKKNNSFINGGIYTGYLLKATSRFKGTLNGVYYDEKSNEDLSVFNKFDFGVGIGGGIRIPINDKNGILVDLRYNFALTFTNKKDNAVIYPKQHTIGLYIGYEFGLNNK